VIDALKVALMSQSDRILKQAPGSEIARREVTIMGDRSVPYSILKKVMATCTTADFGKVSLAVLEKGRVVGA
jgi:biopolymer transport protein ExbD